MAVSLFGTVLEKAGLCLTIDVYVYVYVQGVDKKSDHPQKYSQFGITITGRTEIKENHIFLGCFLRDLLKMLLKC